MPVKESFEAEGKTFSLWKIIPYDEKQPRGQYILFAEADWLDAMETITQANNVIIERLWHIANPLVSDIVYVLTDYDPLRTYGAAVFDE